MEMEVEKLNLSGFIQPIEICKDVAKNVCFCVMYRPVFSVFVCSTITALYLILSSPKTQDTLASLPYEKIISHVKSQTMITLYATLVEVVLELLMAAVLAGVSVIITMWLVFEEVADRKNIKSSKLMSSEESIISSPERKIIDETFKKIENK